MINSLFDNQEQQNKGLKAYLSPLAEVLRPQSLNEVLGQDHLLSTEGTLYKIVESGRLNSIILWGPPGTGKTTIAKLLSKELKAEFIQTSAIFSGVKEIKQIFEQAKLNLNNGKSTILFVDEIHRFNRSQQDSFLPHMEDGTIILIGATTENPSFSLNNALLSRARVLTLKLLNSETLRRLIAKAEGYKKLPLPISDQAKEAIINMADGDGRYLLNIVEDIYAITNKKPKELIPDQELFRLLQKRAMAYDKSQDEHYNLISALHKSVRGSDPNAALYWLARMLNGGEDPMYIIRRVIRMAIEDVGMADPQAVSQALAAKETYETLGSPEGELAIAQAVVYIATSPKSNAIYTAYKKAIKSAKENGSLPPPMHILNAPTKFMDESGYGEGYIYDHDTENAFSGQNYFPNEMGRKKYYQPKRRGFEREIIKRIEYWDKLRQN